MSLEALLIYEETSAACIFFFFFKDRALFLAVWHVLKGTFWYLVIFVNLPKGYFLVLWNVPKGTLVLWNVPKGTFLVLWKFQKVLFGTLECSKVPQNTKKFKEKMVFLNALKGSKHAQEFFSVVWNIANYHG